MTGYDKTAANTELPTRRAFLRDSIRAVAGAALLPTIVPASVLGAEAPSNRVTLGMIGMGRQAYQSNVKTFFGFPDVQVVAVCDVDTWRLENGRKAVEERYAKDRASGTFKGCATYRDFRELLARPDIDAVMISTPDHWHVPMAMAAAQAGKDISCEKPLTLSIAEGRALSDTVRRYSRVFRTDSEFRSHACFQRTCELVLNGRIGKVHTIRTGVPVGDVAGPLEPTMPVPEELDYDLWLGPAPVAPYTVNRVHPRHGYGRPGWMRVRDYCEGMVTNWGAHLNDIAQWGNGTDRTGPVEVEGTGQYPADGLWEVLLGFEIRYRYANGVQLIYSTSQPYVRFEGSEGWIQADYNKRTITAQPQSILSSSLKPDEIHLPLKDEKRDFIDAVKTRGPTLEDAEVGHRTTSLCQLGHIALQVGRKLTWDPQAERFTNDETANRLLGRPMRSPWCLL
ncbi:MAG: Gfo/Idh/MocA family oxidoreductase [Planctomycetes bacterium]|jgi:predicted dehydrogenase|nr:Gfo/Idh/MocA family oxidoreductase [Planctomycetota bacterium]